MRTLIIAFLFFVFALATNLLAGAPETVDRTGPQRIWKPRIDYPLEAQRAGIRGSGVIAVDVDYKTGLVTRAYMLKSSGSRILDEAALSAFRRAKFAGNFKSPVKIPFQFGGQR
ncbi:MAG: energy transducer TonB [Chthoniobacterales bacterium]